MAANILTVLHELENKCHLIGKQLPFRIHDFSMNFLFYLLLNFWKRSSKVSGFTCESDRSLVIQSILMKSRITINAKKCIDL